MTTQTEFLESIKPGAIEGWKKHSILPSITGAQACLESAWGTSDLAEKAHNLFGIKGDYNGYGYFKDSWEVIDGKNTTVRSPFRHYPDKAASVEDHGAFFMSTDWRKENYKNVIGETDYRKAAQALSDAGYATDPNYPEKLINIIEQYELSEWDKEAGITQEESVEVVENSKEESKGETNIMAVIGLDIGHGSNTFPPGKGVYRNSKGYAEHDFNSKLGRRIKELLEANGHKVVMAQPFNSKDVPLRQRTDFYNSQGCDLVLSIHANAGVANASGRCVFYWHSSDSGKRLATLIRDEIKAKGYSTHGSGLHASIVGSWTNLHMVRETRMTSALIEHGFMTNAADFELIFGNKQTQYIEDMAQADVKAIQRFLGQSFKTSEPKTSASSTSSSGLYRVQVGAFGERANAEAMEQRIQDAGFATYVIKDGDLYKIQVGAYSQEANAQEQADKLEAKGFDTYITGGGGSAAAPSKPKVSLPASIAGAKLIKEENAYFLATENIKVRNAPSTGATHTGTLPEGASINYHAVYEGNGYRWLRYTGSTGNTLYVPYRVTSGNVREWGTFHSSRP